MQHCASRPISCSSGLAAALPALLAIVLTLRAGEANAQSVPEITQTIQLRAGWNAVYLEAQPEPRDPARVFEGIPITSVWRYAQNVAAAEFISNPEDGLLEQSNWLAYFPEDSEKSLLTTLDEIQVNRPYLVNLGGGQEEELVVTGRPAVTPLRWGSDAFTLTGFPVDPSGPATFAQFFEGSDGHADAVRDGLIYGLSGRGTWEPIAPGGDQPIQPGAAYWVSTRGGSQHQGPIEVTPQAGDGLDFKTALVEQSIRVRKRSGGPDVDFGLQAVGGSPLVPLSYRTIASVEQKLSGGGTTSACRLTWRAFPGALSLPERPCEAEAGDEDPALDPGQQVVLRLGVVRRAFTADDVFSILEVSNDTGVRWLVPVSASRVTP